MYTTACCKEYDPLTDQGVHLNFWDGRCEAKMGFMVIEWESMESYSDFMGFYGDFMGLVFDQLPKWGFNHQI